LDKYKQVKEHLTLTSLKNTRLHSKLKSKYIPQISKVLSSGDDFPYVPLAFSTHDTQSRAIREIVGKLKIYLALKLQNDFIKV